MKKILFATTAILGVAFVAQSASAQMTVRLGGYVNFAAGFFDHDSQTTASNDFDFDNEVEVHVRADGKTDSGLLYGVKIELETGGTNYNSDGRTFRTDEANMYVGGSWGRVELGDDDGASDQLAVILPLPGLAWSDQGDRFGDPAILGDWAKVLDSSDATKITYLTPTFSGFRAGISYAPEMREGDQVELTDGLQRYDDWIEAGAMYKGEFSGVGIAASATLSSADGNGTFGGQNVDSFTNWQVGLNVSYAGFAFGGGYIDYDDAIATVGNSVVGTITDRAEHGWNLGATYTNGPFAVGVGYATVEFDNFDYSTWAIEADYTVAPGLIVGLAYRPYNIDPNVGNEVDGHTVILGSRLTF